MSRGSAVGDFGMNVKPGAIPEWARINALAWARMGEASAIYGKTDNGCTAGCGSISDDNVIVVRATRYPREHAERPGYVLLALSYPLTPEAA